MTTVEDEVLSPNILSLQEHVLVIQKHQSRIKEAFFDYITAIKAAFEQLGEDVFEVDLARELRMSASTLNRWKSIGSSEIIAENVDSVPPVFSSLYEITLLEKLYINEKGPAKGKAEVQKLFNRGSINPSTETKDIRHYVEKLKRERLAKKRQQKEELLLQNIDAVGYDTTRNYNKLSEAVSDGVKVRTIVITPPKDILTKWADPGYLGSDIHNEFPVSEIRGKSEADTITCLLTVPNARIDVGIKILQASGFNYRRTFFQSPKNGKDEVHLVGQRGHSKIPNTIEGVDAIKIAQLIGKPPYAILFGYFAAQDWVSIQDPI